MTRKIVAVGTAALLILVGVGSLATADARSKRTCTLKNSKSFKKNKEALLFTRQETHQTIGEKRLYGCHRRTRKRVVLADTGGYDPDAILVKLRARFVAVNYTSTDRADMGYGILRLWDLRRPKRLQRVLDVDATDIEIGPKGQLVWIGRPPTDLGEEPQPLSVRDVYGKRKRTLATGNISPRSLRISDTIIAWTQDGARRTAPL